MGIDENDPYRWLKTKEIAVTEKYPIENARASIKTLFSFRDLKNISVTDLEGINERLKECERWLNEYYVGLGKPIRHYDRIKRRKHKLRSLLASIKSDESIAIQARLIFEIHHDTAEIIINLLRGEKNWNSMDVKQKKSILRDEELVGIIDGDKSDVLSCILTNRVINHIKSGKITFKSSHQFCF